MQKFDGATYEPAKDERRLSTQLELVQAFMQSGYWRTLADIAVAVNGTQASVSARLRDLRKPKFGGYTVELRRREGASGLFEYRLVPVLASPTADGQLGLPIGKTR